MALLSCVEKEIALTGAVRRDALADLLTEVDEGQFGDRETVATMYPSQVF